MDVFLVDRHGGDSVTKFAFEIVPGSKDGWIGVRQEGCKDLYFFGFGYDHLGAVKALYRLTGVPPRKHIC